MKPLDLYLQLLLLFYVGKLKVQFCSFCCVPLLRSQDLDLVSRGDGAVCSQQPVLGSLSNLYAAGFEQHFNDVYAVPISTVDATNTEASEQTGFCNPQGIHQLVEGNYEETSSVSELSFTEITYTYQSW